MVEIVPPQSQQNQNINTGANLQANAPLAQPQQKSKSWKIFDFIRTSIFELSLIAIFTLLIVVTFNYFNLIPLSSSFPALSFLPQQTQTSTNTYIANNAQNDTAFFNSNISNLSACNPTVDKNIILNSIITCKNPTKIINTGEKPIYQGIPNTDISSSNTMQINFAVKITAGKGYKPDGLMFGGGPEENRMYVSYDNNSSSWGIQFLYGKSVTPFQSFYYVSNSSTQRSYFSILVSKDGKLLTVLSPNGLMQMYSLKGSLYTKKGTIPTTAVVTPNSELDIYSLNYYTPQIQ